LRNRSYLKFVEALTAAQSVAGIRAICRAICREFGFDHFNYGARFRTSSASVEPTHVSISGYPDAWWRRYQKRNYVANDPPVVHCADRLAPIAWHDARPEDSPNSKIARRILKEARAFGLRDGISLPVHGRGGEYAVLAFATRLAPPRSSRLIESATPVLHLLAFYVHESVRRVMALEAAARPAAMPLTARESEVLRWSARGKTAWETARLMGLSERTANWHMDNVRTKLGALTRQQAVARALARGLISPGE
jgi:LuxR family transcriptional activator of bioluminescence operon